MKTFLLIFSILISSEIIAQDFIFTDHALTSKEIFGTVAIKINGLSQSAFLYRNDSSNFLITAKHILKKNYKRIIREQNSQNIKNEFFDSIPYHDGQIITLSVLRKDVWNEMSARVCMSNDSVDIVAFKVSQIYVKYNHYDLGIDGFMLGQPCYFLGFPLNLYQSTKLSDSVLFSIPIIKRGIISGIVNDGKGNNTFLIDGNNTYGFSGGPVIFYNYNSKQFKVLGVISGYLQQKNAIKDKDGVWQSSFENSGILIACDISKVTELFSKAIQKTDEH